MLLINLINCSSDFSHELRQEVEDLPTSVQVSGLPAPTSNVVSVCVAIYDPSSWFDPARSILDLLNLLSIQEAGPPHDFRVLSQCGIGEFVR